MYFHLRAGPRRLSPTHRHCGYRIGDGPGSFQKGGDGLGSYIACIIMFVCAMDQAHGLDQNKIKWADWAMETGGMEYLLLFF